MANKYGRTKMNCSEAVCRGIIRLDSDVKGNVHDEKYQKLNEKEYTDWCEQRKSRLCYYLRENHDIEVNDDFLKNASLYGLSSQRMFRKFCYPKVLTEFFLRENIDKAAVRTAANIESLIESHKLKCADMKKITARNSIVKESNNLSVILVLDNLRSAYNVGAIIRIAETSGCDKVMCCGITPFPPHVKLERSACGAERIVPMEYFSDTSCCIDQLKNNSYYIFALEEGIQDVPSSPYCFIDFDCLEGRKGIGLVVGAEMVGIDKKIIHSCNQCIEIPMLGLKTSLNVSTATSIVVFEIMRKLGRFVRFNLHP